MFEEFLMKWAQMEAEIPGNNQYYNAGEDVPEISYEIEGLCSDLFITEEGRPNVSNIEAIRKYGFQVYPTERDSFGWLCAACKKLSTNSIIFFG